MPPARNVKQKGDDFLDGYHGFGIKNRGGLEK